MSFNFWAAKFLAKGVSRLQLIMRNILLFICVGYKVGRVDQAETALGAEMRLAADKKSKKEPAKDKGKDKIVRRELNKVYTNGTLVDEELLTDEQAGHCVSIREEEALESDKDGKQTFGICVLDSATSEFNLSAFEDDVCRTKLETMMRQLRPKEIIFTKVRIQPSTLDYMLSVPTTGEPVGLDYAALEVDPARELLVDESARERGVQVQRSHQGAEEALPCR